jgi:hypothetical protein
VTVRVSTWAERPDLAERGPSSEAVWPEYNLHGDVFDDWWTPLLEELPEYQFALCDDAADVVLAEAHTGPLAWNGDDHRLPDGIDDALQRVVAGRRASSPVDTLCAFAAEVDPAVRQRGLAAPTAARHERARGTPPAAPADRARAAVMEGALSACADRALHNLAPRGRRADRSVDASARTPRRARCHGPAPLAAHHRDRPRVGDVDRPRLPESGAYVFPHGLAPLSVDRDADIGTYWEPNVWMIHPELA